jgi:hypothetical protein
VQPILLNIQVGPTQILMVHAVITPPILVQPQITIFSSPNHQPTQAPYFTALQIPLNLPQLQPQPQRAIKNQTKLIENKGSEKKNKIQPNCRQTTATR